MVEYTSRMPTAVEEYSLRGTKHGHATLQSLKLRRSLATSLWSGHDGVLNQLMGLGWKATARLKVHRITTFEDVIAPNNGMIEKALREPTPFATSIVLQNSLKLSALVEYTAGSTTPYSLICRTEQRNDIPRSDQDSDFYTPAVTYTLMAYTDEPGGRVHLVQKRNIARRELQGRHTSKVWENW